MAALLDRLLLPALNHLVRAETWAQERLRTHGGAHIFVVAGPLSVPLQIDEHGTFRAPEAARAADVTLTLPADAPLRFLFERDAVFSAVRLDGTADIAESLAFVFRNLRWDAEGDLAMLVGDIAARRIVRAGRSLAAALTSGARRSAENIAEFAAEDSMLLVPNREMAQFCESVSRLAEELSCLERRMDILSR